MSFTDIGSAFGQSSFAQKLLTFTIQAGQNTGINPQPSSFAASGQTVTISGHRATCRITNAGAPAAGQADIAIYGMDGSLMNQLATLGMAVDSVQRNNILVGAGVSSSKDASAAASVNASPSSGLPIVFGGTILLAFPDYNSQPNVPFRIIAQIGLAPATISAKPSSFTGTTDVATIMQGLAGQLGVAFENNGVNVKLSNPYYPGTIMQQIYQIADHAFINALLVDGGTKLAIWPTMNADGSIGSRTTQTNVPLIAPPPAGGMVGYPTFQNNGMLLVKMVYNPDVVFGGNIKVQSSIPQANKTWNVKKLELSLDTLFPDGEWMMAAQCWPVGQSQSAPPAL